MFIKIDNDGNILGHDYNCHDNYNIEVSEQILINLEGNYQGIYKYKYIDVQYLISEEVPESIEKKLVSEEVAEVLDEEGNVITPFQAAVYEDIIIPAIPAVYNTVKELVLLSEEEMIKQPCRLNNLSLEARQQRDKLLAECDFVVMTYSPASAECKANFKIYRQDLRDITEQEGFPINIVWPIKPNYEKA